MPKKCVIKTRKRWRSNLWVGEAVIVGVEEGLPRLFAGLQIILQFANFTIELCEDLPPAPETQPHKRGDNSGLAQIYKRAGSRMCHKCGRAGGKSTSEEKHQNGNMGWRIVTQNLWYQFVSFIIQMYSVCQNLVQEVFHQHMTHCQDECRSLSGGVPKNLTLHWMKKYFFLFTIINGRSVAFQPCITLGGVSWVDFGENNNLSKKVP